MGRDRSRSISQSPPRDRRRSRRESSPRRRSSSSSRSRDRRRSRSRDRSSRDKRSRSRDRSSRDKRSRSRDRKRSRDRGRSRSRDRRRSVSPRRSVSGERKVKKEDQSSTSGKRARRWDKTEDGKRWDVPGPNIKIEDGSASPEVKRETGGERQSRWSGTAERDRDNGRGRPLPAPAHPPPDSPPRGRGGGGKPAFEPPPLFSVQRGTVKRVTDFGAFVELNSYRSRWGLVHYSQIRDAGGERVAVEEEVALDQSIWVKVMDVDVEQQRIGLSMKFVDQESGKDSDPFQMKSDAEKIKEEARRQGGGRGGGGGKGNAFDRGKKEEEEYAQHSWGRKRSDGGNGEEEDDDDGKPKEEKSFALSGLLAAETRMWEGIELKFIEPAEARMPDKKWRLYEFKGEENTTVLHIHRASCYIFGRDRHLKKFPGYVATDHPSCSKQHAVIQFRLQEKDDGMGGVLLKVKPYLMDLQTTNGTFLNGDKIEDQRYYELKEKDTIKFGNSSRDYVLLLDTSK